MGGDVRHLDQGMDRRLSMVGVLEGCVGGVSSVWLEGRSGGGAGGFRR